MSAPMTRRAALALPVAAGASVAVGATCAPAAVPAADAALMALCDEFQSLTARMWNLGGDTAEDENTGDDLARDMEAIGNAMAALPPAPSDAVMWARVGVVLAWRPSALRDPAAPSLCLDDRLTALVLRDLAAFIERGNGS